jgi:hypothetical protein
VTAFVVIGLLAPPTIGPSGSNGESVPNEAMNPLLLFEVIHSTVVPALTQNSLLFFASGMLGFTLAELDPLLMSTLHGDESEPQVLAAVHRFSNSFSSHAYLLVFCDCMGAQIRTAKEDNKTNLLQGLNCR